MRRTNLQNIQLAGLFLFSLLVCISCERDISDDAVPATFPNTAEVFTDNPVGLTDEFFISFDPADGANPEAFDVDTNEAYMGTSSIRVDVPSPDNPNGNFVGAIFRDRGEGRDLTGYDALTFWAKGSTTGTLSEVGFGTDFLDSKFPASVANLQLTTNWQKYIIPIPDPSKLTQERGLFLFAAGGIDVVDDIPNGNEIGWTFWLDEIRYEKLGTIGQKRPRILNGQDVVRDVFNGLDIALSGLTTSFNLPTGQNVSVATSPNYFDFSTTSENIADVNVVLTPTNGWQAIASVLTEGQATISATLGDMNAEGSLTVSSSGDFESAPDPTLPASDVLSIYSDFYSNIDALNVGAFNNENIGIQTQSFSGNEQIVYENLAFVGLSWNNTIDVSSFTTLHIDVQRLTPGSNFVVELLDYGPDGVNNGFGDGSAGGFNATFQMINEEWVGLDIPLSSFTLPTGGGGSGNPNLNNIGNIILVSNGGAFLIDNIYFY